MKIIAHASGKNEKFNDKQFRCESQSTYRASKGNQDEE